MRKRHGVIQVHGLAFGFGSIGIDQDDFRRQPAEQQSIGEGRPHVAHADNRDSGGTRLVTPLQGSWYLLTRGSLTVNTALLSNTRGSGNRPGVGSSSGRAVSRS